jgi:hypothetical protein
VCQSSADRLRGPPVVVVQHHADSFAALDASSHVDSASLIVDQLVVDSLMIAVDVVVPVYSLTAWRKCCSPRGIISAKHSDLIERTNRSASAFRLGLLAGSFTVVTPRDGVDVSRPRAT